MKLILLVLTLLSLTGISIGSTSTEAMAYAEGIATSSYWISSKMISVNITYNSDDNWLVVSGIVEPDDHEYLDGVVSDGAELAIKVTERYPSMDACAFIVFRPDGDTFVEVTVYN